MRGSIGHQGRDAVISGASNIRLPEPRSCRAYSRHRAPDTVIGASGMGGYSAPSNRGDLGLVETWNGRTWAISARRNNPTSTGGSLQGVSCRSAATCVAVGDSFAGSRSGGSAEDWSGRIWTIKPVPNPGGATDVLLDSVSCGSARACVAVGNYVTGQFAPEMPLAEAWNGTTWTIKTAPF